MDIENDYWFTIEPYVFINIANNCALLYNTYDGKILISKKAKVIELLNTFFTKKRLWSYSIKTRSLSQF